MVRLVTSSTSCLSTQGLGTIPDWNSGGTIACFQVKLAAFGPFPTQSSCLCLWNYCTYPLKH